MADTETKRIIEIEAKYETLAELRTALVEAKTELMKVDQALQDGNASYAEQEKAIAAVKAAQAEYNTAQRITVKEVTAAKGSYNDLVNQLARLKEQWKQADPKSDAYKDLTAQVNKTKTQLENMDHSIGNWQRNVGNYSNSIKDVAGLFGTAGTNAAKSITGIQGMTTGLKAMSATPAIAILSALVTVLQKVKDSFSSSEANVQRLTVALAPLKSVGDLTTKVFQGLGDVVVKVADYFGKLADKLGWVTDEMKERQELAKEEISLQQAQRKALMENADAEREASELRSKAADKNKYTAQERIAYLEAAGQKEKEIMERNRDLAQREYELIKTKNSLTESSTAELDAEAQAYVKLQQAQMSYFNKTKEITGQVAELRNQLGAKDAAMWNGIKEDAIEADIDIQEIDLKAIAKKEKDADALAARLRAARQKRALEEIEDERKKALDLAELELTSATEREQAVYDINADYNQRKLDLLKQYATEASQSGDVAAYLDFQQQAADQEYNIWLNAKKKELQLTKQNDQQKLQSATAYAKGVSSILSVVSAAWQANIQRQVEAGEISEEEGERQFNNVKALQYATTWINTFAAMTSALADPTPMPYAIKAINAASAFASGIASTIQIANTRLGASATSATSASSALTTSTTAPSISMATPTTRIVTTEADEQAISDRQNAQRVYVVYDDIDEAGRQVEVQKGESSF